MNLVFILRKFIFDSGRAGEEVNDRKRREGPETLWGCPTTPQAAHGQGSNKMKQSTKIKHACCFSFFKAEA